MGENTHKINIHEQGLKVFMNVVNYEKAKVHEELMAKIGKGMATNGNELGVELE